MAVLWGEFGYGASFGGGFDPHERLERSGTLAEREEMERSLTALLEGVLIDFEGYNQEEAEEAVQGLLQGATEADLEAIRSGLTNYNNEAQTWTPLRNVQAHSLAVQSNSLPVWAQGDRWNAILRYHAILNSRRGQ